MSLDSSGLYTRSRRRTKTVSTYHELQPYPIDRTACWRAVAECTATEKNRRPGPLPGDVNMTWLVRHFTAHRLRGVREHRHAIRSVVPTILAALTYAANMEFHSADGLKDSDKREAAKARRKMRRFLAVAARVSKLSNR